MVSNVIPDHNDVMEAMMKSKRLILITLMLGLAMLACSLGASGSEAPPAEEPAPEKPEEYPAPEEPGEYPAPPQRAPEVEEYPAPDVVPTEVSGIPYPEVADGGEVEWYKAVAMVIPALGPSLGMAPAGICKWMSDVWKKVGSMPMLSARFRT